MKFTVMVFCIEIIIIRWAGEGKSAKELIKKKTGYIFPK
jgi:hypothetical protein